MTVLQTEYADEVAEELCRRIGELWIIDAHDHLPPEADRLAMQVDAVSIFENYPMWDLKVAGMSDDEYLAIVDRDGPLEERWEVLSRYLPAIRNTSFTRSTLLGVRELYGYEDITSENYREVTQAMQAANKPGIYRQVFRDHGRILVALNQLYPGLGDDLPGPSNFRIPQMWESQFSVAFGVDALSRVEEHLGCSVSSLDAYVEALAGLLGDYRNKGVVGIKLDKPTIQSHPQFSDVAPLFERVVGSGRRSSSGETELRGHEYWQSERARPGTGFDRSSSQGLPLAAAEQTVLRDYVAHAIIRIAGELGLVVIQHSGHRGLWQDYRLANPTNLIPVFMEHPEVRFELYHTGMPWVRETGMIAKAFPNVWLNMCWGHSLSRQMARSALDEWLDLVPANKIIAFGGDTFLWVEWVLGELVQTRENIAAVLAKRVGEGLLTEERAMDLAKLMLCDNPKNLYQLECQPSDHILYE